MFNCYPLRLLPALMLFAAPVMASDTGDAPASYGLASHDIGSSTPFLGVVPPDDNAPVETVNADGDDIANGDDEDGVTSFATLFQNIKAYSVNVLVNNQTAGDATLYGWIDFDGNGTFDADESATSILVTSTSVTEVELLWPSLQDPGITTDFAGTTYARFRISTDPVGDAGAAGSVSDGEVEDYAVEILLDTDGDEIPNPVDLDDDNDGIPDAVDGIGVDTDNDGVDNALDTDSDNDSIPDQVEAGPVPGSPVDTDSDGVPDFLDQDSDNDGTLDAQPAAGDDDGDGLTADLEGAGDTDGDGIVNTQDIDSDNDTILDAIEAVDTDNPVDTDNDGVPDFLDLDSDNDGIPDLYEASGGAIDAAALDADGDGRVDSGRVFGSNGLVDDAETTADSGVPSFQVVDTDNDGAADYVDTDSDNDLLTDTIESGGLDADGNGVVDALSDTDDDGIPDNVDVNSTGGADADADGIDDAFDTDFVATADTDGDGIVDASDLDVDGDGIIDGSNAIANAGSLLDDDNDGIPNFQDDDLTPVTPVTPVAPVAPDVPRIETGLDGFPGCSILAGSSSRLDPTFILLAITAFGVLFLRRRDGLKRLPVKVRRRREM